MGCNVQRIRQAVTQLGQGPLSEALNAVACELDNLLADVAEEQAVENSTELLSLTSQVPPAAYDGSEVLVRSFRDRFYLDKQSTLTPDGRTIFADPQGGRWIRDINEVNIAWLQQTEWFISSVSGNDENPGTEALPLRTFKEFVTRIGRGNTTSDTGVDIYIEDDLADDVMNVSYIYQDKDVSSAPSIFTQPGLRFRGRRRVVASGTVQAIQDRDPLNGQRMLLTDLGLSGGFAQYEGLIIQFPDRAPTEGLVPWSFVIEETSPGVAQIAIPVDISLPGAIGFTPTPGEPYEIVEIPLVKTLITGSPGSYAGTNFYNLNFGFAGPGLGAAQKDGFHNYFACTSILDSPSFRSFCGGNVLWWSCGWRTHWNFDQSSFTDILGGYMTEDGPGPTTSLLIISTGGQVNIVDEFVLKGDAFPPGLELVTVFGNGVLNIFAPLYLYDADVGLQAWQGGFISIVAPVSGRNIVSRGILIDSRATVGVFNAFTPNPAIYNVFPAFPAIGQVQLGVSIPITYAGYPATDANSGASYLPQTWFL